MTKFKEVFFEMEVGDKARFVGGCGMLEKVARNMFKWFDGDTLTTGQIITYANSEVELIKKPYVSPEIFVWGACDYSGKSTLFLEEPKKTKRETYIPIQEDYAALKEEHVFPRGGVVKFKLVPVEED